ncbi:MAG: hypothetical protein ACLR9P_00755 [Escherichia coli]
MEVQSGSFCHPTDARRRRRALQHHLRVVNNRCIHHFAVERNHAQAVTLASSAASILASRVPPLPASGRMRYAAGQSGAG